MEAVAASEWPAGHSEVALRGPAEQVQVISDLFDQRMRELAKISQ